MAQQRPEFTVREEVTDAALVVTVIGEVDLATAPQLRDVLEHAITTAPAVLVLDMSEVSYFDSTGLDVLIHISTALDTGRLRLVASAAVIRPLTLTGIDSLIPLHPDLASALEHNADNR